MSSIISVFLNFLSIVVALLAVVFVCFKWRYQYWKRKNVPYIEPRIPFGSLGNPFTDPTGDKLVEIYKIARERGWKYCGIYAFLTPILLIVDVDLIKHILTKDFQHFSDRGIYTNEEVDTVGCHLFALGGYKWRNMRIKLSPTFTTDNIKIVFQTLVTCGLVLEKHVEDNVKPDQPVDIKKLFSCFATDVVGSCNFSLNCNSYEEPDSIFIRTARNICSLSIFRVILITLAQSYPRLARGFRIPQIPKDVAKYWTKMVEDIVLYRERNNLVKSDLLQLLMNLKGSSFEERNDQRGNDNTLTMDEIVAQSFVFFLGGFETSSSTMTFALFELAMHPDIQDRLRDEISSVLARHDDKLTYDSLSEMKYLKQVIDETMRIRPVGRILQRLCMSDYKVPEEDLVIKKGTRVFISIPGVHWDEKHWENPQVFDPERFTEEKKKNMNKYTYLPFGQGPRMCIGARLGLIEVKLGLIHILRKFRVKLNEKTMLPLRLSVKTLFSSAEGGIWLNFEKLS